MELFNPNANFDFIGKKNFFIGLSFVLFFIALFLIFTRGLNYGVDFRGGTQIYLRINKSDIAASDVRGALEKIGFQDATVQDFGDSTKHEFLLKLDNKVVNADETSKKIVASLTTRIKDGKISSYIFKDGQNFYVTYDKPIDVEEIKGVMKSLTLEQLILSKNADSVMKYGKLSNNEYVIRFDGVSKKVEANLREYFGEQNVEILQDEYVGPQVGEELKRDGILACLISFVLLLIYVGFRFDTRYSPGAVISLIHDTVITMGVFSFFQIEFNLSIVAAILTLIGYSINDTIVVYDRIRENSKKYKMKTVAEIMNISINQTMSRTVLTSLATLLVTVALWILGGSIIRGMAIALTFGIVIGTYSSVYVAAPLTLILKNYYDKGDKGKVKK